MVADSKEFNEIAITRRWTNTFSNTEEEFNKMYVLFVITGHKSITISPSYSSTVTSYDIFTVKDEKGNIFKFMTHNMREGVNGVVFHKICNDTECEWKRIRNFREYVKSKMTVTELPDKETLVKSLDTAIPNIIDENDATMKRIYQNGKDMSVEEDRLVKELIDTGELFLAFDKLNPQTNSGGGRPRRSAFRHRKSKSHRTRRYRR